jgi:hypothetical protein
LPLRVRQKIKRLARHCNYCFSRKFLAWQAIVPGCYATEGAYQWEFRSRWFQEFFKAFVDELPTAASVRIAMITVCTMHSHQGQQVADPASQVHDHLASLTLNWLRDTIGDGVRSGSPILICSMEARVGSNSAIQIILSGLGESNCLSGSANLILIGDSGICTRQRVIS